MREHLEFVSVVPIQTILSSEPHESLIVLYDLSNLGLGEPLSGRQSGESDIVCRLLLEKKKANRDTIDLRYYALSSRRVYCYIGFKTSVWNDLHTVYQSYGS